MTAEEEAQQLQSIRCVICLQDVQPGEPTNRCRECSSECHRGCIHRWLITRRATRKQTNCPNCREPMQWLLNELPAELQCTYCGQPMRDNVQQFICPTCHGVYHLSEIPENILPADALNNPAQQLTCWNCHAKLIAARLNRLPIQPAQQNNTINNFNLADEDDSES